MSLEMRLLPAIAAELIDKLGLDEEAAERKREGQIRGAHTFESSAQTCAIDPEEPPIDTGKATEKAAQLMGVSPRSVEGARKNGRPVGHPFSLFLDSGFEFRPGGFQPAAHEPSQLPAVDLEDTKG
jgi:hypothetical protein